MKPTLLATLMLAIPLAHAADLKLDTDEQKAAYFAGMQIGAHTVTHPILAQLDPAEAREELARCRRDLQDQLQQPVSLFAYPNGKPDVDYSAQTVSLARELGFDAAVTTASGAASRGSSIVLS